MKIIDDLKFYTQQAVDLDREYKGKSKGEIYLKRLAYIKRKVDFLVRQLDRTGIIGLKLWKGTIETKEGKLKSFQILLPSEFEAKDIPFIVSWRYKNTQVHLIKDIECSDEFNTGELTIENFPRAQR